MASPDDQMSQRLVMEMVKALNEVVLSFGDLSRGGVGCSGDRPLQQTRMSDSEPYPAVCMIDIASYNLTTAEL